MVRRCSDKMAKLLLVVFNALFLVCGVALVIVGCIDFKDAKSVNEIVGALNSVNIITIIVGAVIVVISFLGCCGAYKESSCMLNTFLGLLLIILITEIAIGYFALKNRSQVEDALEKSVLDTLNQTETESLKHAWDDIQLSWSCCGATGPQDYQTFKRPIPPSCCKKAEDNKKDFCPREEAFKDGCFSKMKTLIERNSLGIGVTAIIIAFIEVAGIIFACCLRGAINERYQTV